MLQDFKQFVLRGNVVDLAVGVLIGAAFATVVKSFTDHILTPLFAMLGGKPNFNGLSFTINNARFGYGAFITEVISFVITAAIIFFFVVKPINHLMERRRSQPSPDPTTRDCPECLSEVPIAARRCAFCTAQITPAA